MAKKSMLPRPQHFWAEGARGGSFVDFTTSEAPEMIDVKVGHSCIVTVRETMPVTWLAAVLTHAKDIGFANAMGDKRKFPADYALMCNPEPSA